MTTVIMSLFYYLSIVYVTYSNEYLRKFSRPLHKFARTSDTEHKEMKTQC